MDHTAPRDQPIVADARAVAWRLGVSLTHVRTLIRDGRLPASKLGRRVLIRHDDVAALLTRTRIAAPVGG